MSIFANLNRQQKEAVGLLSIGTFLEYFDLMLYVHMAVLLNELFFPKTDPFTASLLAAFSFCSTYLLRPFGALVFGYIGDNIGRKQTVVITTFIMSISCIIMANLPTYAQIGISAAWVVTLCRILQGMCSMGEATGAELYLTEMLSPPLRYPVVACIVIFATIGTTSALGIASFILSNDISWRVVFWIGAVVAFIGTLARTTLRETPEFADAKRRLKRIVESSHNEPKQLENSPIWKEKVNKKTALSLFLIQCMWPAAMYLSYIHCGNIAKALFDFSPEQVINQNFFVSSMQLVTYIGTAYVSYRIHPLSILKVKLVMFACFVLVSPFLLYSISSPFQLMLFQIYIVTFVPTDFPAASVFYKHFPVFKRFTFSCLMYALSRATMSIITSIGLVYFIDRFGNWGVLLIMLPVVFGYRFGLVHFETLEQAVGNYRAGLSGRGIFVYN